MQGSTIQKIRSYGKEEVILLVYTTAQSGQLNYGNNATISASSLTLIILIMTQAKQVLFFQ